MISSGQLATQSIQAVHFLLNLRALPAPGGRICNFRRTREIPDLANASPAAVPARMAPAEIRNFRRPDAESFSGFAALNEIHSFGHSFKHVIQRIQRSLSMCFCSMSIHPAGHVLAHLPHWMHSSDICNLRTEWAEIAPRTVPTGHSEVQKNLFFQTVSAKISSSTISPPSENEAKILPELE